MDLDELRALIAVVETGSFSAAAKSLKFARATLRRRIDELEARLGVTLLERDGQTVKPTSAGELVVARGPGVLAEARSLMSAIRKMDRRTPRVLDIALVPGPPPEMMERGFRVIAPLQPELTTRLTFLEDPTQFPEGTSIALDVAEHPPVGPFRVQPLARIPVRVFGTPEELSRRPVSTVEDLEGRRVCTWRNREGTLDQFRLRSGGSVPFSPVYVTSDITLLSHLAKAKGHLVYAPEPPTGYADWLQPVLPDVIGFEVHARMLIPDDSEDAFVELLEHLTRFIASVGKHH